MNPRRRFARVVLLLAACAAGGCTSLATRIAEPHSERGLDAAEQRQFEHVMSIAEMRMRTPDGVEIAYRVVPAATRGMHYALTRTPSRTAFKLNFNEAIEPLATRGTVVYLHGWEMDASSMLPWALALSERGYRGIALDLRNHGDSSRAPAGFGPREARDVVALFDSLQAQGELQTPVYLFGVSYGAATALFAEPALRARIAGIVAMEPYANAADGIRGIIAGALSKRGSGLRSRLFHAYLRHRYDATDVDEAIATAGRRLAIDLEKVDVREPLVHSQTCILLLHGARDEFIPVATARALATTTPRISYRELPDENHMTLPARIDWLAQPVTDWLQATTPTHCPQLTLPPDPARTTN